MTVGRGSSAKLAIKRETVFGTAPTGPYELVPFTQLDLARTQDLEDENVLGLGRDAQRPARNAAVVRGQITVPVDVRSIGHWLSMLFGTPTTTGAGPYTHVWKSGADALPSYTLEEQHGYLSPKVYFQSKGVMADGMSVDFDQSGRPVMQIDLVAKSQEESAASIAGAATSRALTRFNQFQSFVKRDGTDMARILSANLPYRNNLEESRYVGGGGDIGDITPGMAAVRGRLTARFVDSALFALARAEQLFDLQLGFERSASEKITWEIDQAELTTNGKSISGPGGIQADFNLVGSRDAVEGQTMTITLINDVQAY